MPTRCRRPRGVFAMSGSAVLGDNLVDDLLPVVDELRGDLHPDMGVRQFRVSTVVRTWPNGEMPGEGDVYQDAECEIEPQPKIHSWGQFEIDLERCGLDELGEIMLSEVSLTYTHDELTGGDLASNQQFYIKISDAHGQGIPPRYFAHQRPPFPDREKTIGWKLWLRSVEVPG